MNSIYNLRRLIYLIIICRCIDNKPDTCQICMTCTNYSLPYDIVNLHLSKHVKHGKLQTALSICFYIKDIDRFLF